MEKTLLEKLNNKKNIIIKKLGIENGSFKNFEGKSKKIITENGFRLEEIARELLMQTYLSTEKDMYVTELYCDDAKRADLVSKINDNISCIIEVKSTEINKNKKDISKIVDDSFSQLKNFYIHKVEKDCFISVFIMDVEYILDNPDMITRYFNLSSDNRNNLSNFEKYGIYMETRKYNSMNKMISISSWHSLPRHGHFFIKENTSSIINISKIYCEIQNAINLPTSSSNSFGIKNVRDIKDPSIFAEKRDLILDIMDTILQAFKLQNTEIITTAGKEKEFLAISDETIHYAATTKNGARDLSISTLNGAIIDGQNSIDAFRWIINTLEKKIKKEHLDDILIEKKINAKLDDSFNEKKVKDLLGFIQHCPIVVNIEQTDDVSSARKKAISKNNTMQVTKGELEMSNFQIQIHFLAIDLLEKHGINIIFPKKESFLEDNKLSQKIIDISKLANYNFCIELIEESISKNEFNIGALFPLSQKLGGKVPNTAYEKLQKKYIYKEQENNQYSLEHQEKINNLANDIKIEKNGINVLEESVKTTSHEHVEMLLEKIKLKKEALEDLIDQESREKDKLEKFLDTSYKVIDSEKLSKIIERILLVEKIVEKEFEDLLNNDEELWKKIKKMISGIDKFKHYIMVMTYLKYPKSIDTVPKKHISDIFKSIVQNIAEIIDDYIIDMTTLRNPKDENSKVSKKDGTSVTILDVKQLFFKITEFSKDRSYE